MDKPFHRRLRGWEAFDEIRFKVVPRYKTSGLSGDEWRQHVQVEFLHKGQVVHEAGFRDMQAALMYTPREWSEAQCPISDKVIELERTHCDQPSCAKPPIGRLLLKELTSDEGDYLDPARQHLRYYRQFCATHIRRGDCSREDADSNYVPLDGVTADNSTNLEESPSAMAPPVIVNLGDLTEVE